MTRDEAIEAVDRLYAHPQLQGREVVGFACVLTHVSPTTNKIGASTALAHAPGCDDVLLQGVRFLLSDAVRKLAERARSKVLS